MKKFIQRSLFIAGALCSICLIQRREEPVISPPPPATPRINGARVFGVRPGSPLLYTIAASGLRPMQFMAENLPAGLQLNPESGQITGGLEIKGDYRVTLIAQNDLGCAQRDLLIRCGEEICLTPPMGWNSWYCLSEAVSDKAIRQTAKAFVDKGLVNHGWSYVNIDDCWQGVREDGAIQGNERFPDMGGLCDYVHALGLKIGIYSTPWQATYAGFIGGSVPEEGYEAHALPEKKRRQKHQFFGRYPKSLKLGLNKVAMDWRGEYDARQWAEWGFDYVKQDWNPNDVPTTGRLLEDLKKSGRDIVLSLSNTAPYENAAGLSELANCWRTSGDIIDRWFSVSRIGFSQARWQRFTKPGHFNDPDMLQLGRIGTPNRQNKKSRPSHLSKIEQQSQFSLWCILSAPLILSCAIEELDEFTLSLLTNDEVIAVNQDPLAAPAERIKLGFGIEAWTKPLADGGYAIGIFNRLPFRRTARLDKLRVNGTLRDLWRQADASGNCFSLAGHGCVMLRTKI